jgi:hypothetical protein
MVMTLSVAHCLFRQGGRIDDHGVHAARLGNERGDRAVARGQCAVDDRGRLVGAGEGNTAQGGMRQQHLADARAVTGQELQYAARNTRLMQQLHGLEGDERRLLGGLGHHRVSGGKGRGHLAREDRQRKIPR